MDRTGLEFHFVFAKQEQFTLSLDIIQNCNLNENFVVYECFLAEPKTAWVANSF